MKQRKFWQQACGDTDRNYASICLKWGVILNGPGDFGAWPECELLLLEEGVSSRKVTDLRRFAEDMTDGDVVVLRLGTKDVLAVGVIVGEYEWLEIFGDVDGWDIQHVRRVKWLWSDLARPHQFKTYDLKQGDTTQKLTSKVVIDWIDNLALDFDSGTEVPVLPSGEGNLVSFEVVSDFLFDSGISSNAIETLSNEMDELVRIARWYQKYDDPSEFETVAYLAIPLLRALGWTPQKMAIEWRKVDIALFNSLPRRDESLSVVVEAKKKVMHVCQPILKPFHMQKGKKGVVD